MNEKPPTGLGAKARKFWVAAVSEFDFRIDELRVLEDACREMDLIDRMEKEQRGRPLIARGSQGQEVAAPLVQELRQHRTSLARLLSQLQIPDDDGGASRSAAARELVMARWQRGS